MSRRSNRFGGTVPLFICAVGITAFVLISLPCLMPTRPVASRNACISNLRQLDGAKEQWTLEHSATNLGPVKVQEVLGYIKGGTMPECSGGGRYYVNLVGLPPYCSNSKHTLLNVCRWNIEALNHAVQVWLLDHPSARRSDVVTSELFGFGKPVYPVPVCENGGKYSFDRQLGVFKCDANHDEAQ